MMKVKQFEIWIADLNPRLGTEAGKIRPVLVIQTDLLNKEHPSTIICPVTTNVQPEAKLLRVHLKKSQTKLKLDCDVMVDQLRAIDNKRLMRKIGEVNQDVRDKIRENLKIILDIE